MTTPKRNYEPGVPVLATFRFHLRTRLFDVAPLVELFIKQVARWSVDAHVDILAFSVRCNHAHLILVQHDEGCPATTGIAAFMRNVLSPTAKYANRLLGSKGHVVESTYDAHPIGTVNDLVRHISYVHHQDQHHGQPGHQDSRPVYLQQQIDGVVTHMPLIQLTATATPQERRARLLELMHEIAEEALRREDLRDQDADPTRPDLTPREYVQSLYPWFGGAMHVKLRHRDQVRLDDDVRTLPLTDLRADPRFAPAWHRLQRWRPTCLAVEPLPVPRVGQRLRVELVIPPTQRTRDRRSSDRDPPG